MFLAVENTHAHCICICTKNLLSISVRVSFWHSDGAVWKTDLDEPYVRCKCHADSSNREANFIGLRVFFFFPFVSVLTMEAWKRYPDQLSICHLGFLQMP